jgi:3-hydroxy-9,10-secoandrosta-1,3,5(10)-triene-9,17-dione monooxygenase
METMTQEMGAIDLERRANNAKLVERAREIAPQLRQRVKEMDQLRRLPEATVKELLEAKLFQLTTPRIYGGHQVDMRTFLDVVAEIGRGDASTAWVLALTNVCTWLATVIYPETTLQEIFSTEGGARICAQLTPRQCTIKRVEGGYFIEKGLWAFNSGAYQANWDLLGIPILNERGEAVDEGLALLPMQDVDLLDDWNTIGLQGTGSTSVTVQNKFVPDHRVASMTKPIEGNYASLNLRNEVEYRWAFVPTLALILAFPLLGAARGMLELFLERLPGRGILYTWYTKQAEATLTHLQVAEAAAKIDAAQLLLQRSADDIQSYAERGEHMEYLKRGRVRMDSGYAARLLFEATDIIGEAAGGSFTATNNLLNHIWRDVRTGSLHAVLNPTTNQELYGRLLCGQPANTPLV